MAKPKITIDEADISCVVAMNNSYYTEYAIAKLLNLRDDYSSEISKEIIHNHGCFKVRGVWFGVIGLTSGCLYQRGLISKDTLEYCEDMLKVVHQNMRLNQRTTPNDINVGDRIINTLLSRIESSVEFRVRNNYWAGLASTSSLASKTLALFSLDVE